jgi:hypothetical protein
MIDPNNKPQWKAAYFDFATRWIQSNEDVFAFEDIKLAWLAKKYPAPHHHSVWACMALVIIKELTLIEVGFRAARSRKTHGHPVREYVRFQEAA